MDTKPLHDFLLDAFSKREFHIILKMSYPQTRKIVSELPDPDGIVSDAEYFDRVVSALKMRGLIGPGLFQHLVDAREARESEIRALQRKMKIPAPDVANRGGQQTQADYSPVHPAARIAYEAHYGVVRTHLWHSLAKFQSFIHEAIDLSEQMQDENYDTRILSTYLDDTMDRATLTRVLGLGIDAERPVRVCLVNPYCSFASARAASMLSAENSSMSGRDPVQAAVKEARTGMAVIVNALLELKGRAGYGRAYYGDEDYDAMVRAAKALGKERNVEFRFFNYPIAGPLWFFRDVLVMGRISAFRSAQRLPWSLIVNDSRFDDDIYDIMGEEFESVWMSAGSEPRQP